jgi:hypothetical protein
MRIASFLNRVLPVGSRSLLFGVHQFIWHPITVAVAWRKLYGKWPTFLESICILVHDWGYWGCSDMDGERGKRHPELGSRLAATWVARVYRWRVWSCVPLVLLLTKIGHEALKKMAKERAFGYYLGQLRGGINARCTLNAIDAHFLVRYHSRSMAKLENAPTSPLCAPDKLCVLFDPHWFYWLRATLSGEGREFRQNAVSKIGLQSLSHWLYWYRNSIRKQYENSVALGGVDDKP